MRPVFERIHALCGWFLWMLLDKAQSIVMNQLTFPFYLFHQYLGDLMRHRRQALRCPIGASVNSRSIELIAAHPQAETKRGLLLSTVDTFQELSVLDTDTEGALFVGRGQQRGRARGFIRLSSGQIAPIHRLCLVGPGMHTVALSTEQAALVTEDDEAEEAQMDSWSRTIGALGAEAFQRLVGLRFGVIGIGRTGSNVALALARLGVRQLTLIDPDTIEPHNLGEMQCITPVDVDLPKVQAVAEGLRARAKITC